VAWIITVYELFNLGDMKMAMSAKKAATLTIVTTSVGMITAAVLVWLFSITLGRFITPVA